MNIYTFAKTEERYKQKIRYIVELFFSTYGIDYQPLESLDQLFEAKSPRPNLLLLYGSWEDYQNLKTKISSDCHILFVLQLFQQVFESELLEVKRLKEEKNGFSLPIFLAYPISVPKSLYLVKEKSGREYPGIGIERSNNQIRIVCGADLFASSFYLLTLQQEGQSNEKEGGERFLAQGSLWEKENAVHIPLINHYFRILFELLQMVSREAKVPLISKKFWPTGSNLAVALTHDVDILDNWSLYFLFRIWVLLKKGRFKALSKMFFKFPGFFFKGNKSLRGIDLILYKEKRKGFNSTFFFLAGKPNLKKILESDITYSVKKVKPAVEKILNSHGEVGLHGSLNSYQNKEDLREEKESLDNFLSSPCVGIRQHFLYLKVPQTWRLQGESGFLYDCTLAYPDRSGFRSGFAFPFKPYDFQTDQEMGIWEINTNVMDQTYDKYDPKGKEEIKKEIEKIQEELESANGGLITLLWHTNVLEEFGFPDFLDLYGELLEVFFQRKAFVSTAESIIRFWTARKEVKLVDSKLDNNSRRWTYRSNSPIKNLTFSLSLPDKGKVDLKVEGAEALIKMHPKEACITFPRLDRNQSFRISLICEES